MGTRDAHRGDNRHTARRTAQKTMIAISILLASVSLLVGVLIGMLANAVIALSLVAIRWGASVEAALPPQDSESDYRVHAAHVMALGTATRRSVPMGRPQAEHVP